LVQKLPLQKNYSFRKMQELRELTDIATPKKLKSVANLGVTALPNPRMRKFYDLVSSGKVQTDEEAIAVLFPGQSNPPHYFRLKNALRDYLHRMLFLIDLNLPHYHLRQSAYFDCYRQWATMKLLIGKNARGSQIALATDLLRMTRKYEFTDLTVDIARNLRLYYGSIEGNVKKYEQYGALTHEYDEILQQENLAEELYTDLVLRFVNDKSAKEDVHQKALQCFRQIEPALAKHDTYRLHLSGRLIEVLVHTSVNDYRQTVDVCDRAIRFFEAKDYTANVPLHIFLQQEMVCFVQLRDYQRGKTVAERGMTLIEEGTFNWFKYQELLLMLSFHTQEYQAAYEIFKSAVQHRRFGALPESVRQVWNIQEAYLFYLWESGLVQSAPGDDIFSRFRISRFMNDTPLYSRDKRGMNIAILVFQIVWLIANKKYNETIDRMDAIGKYSTRYLSKDDTFRSNCFIKMLLAIPAANFHRVAVLRAAEKYTTALRTMPLDFAQQSHDVEIIPYEHLWNMVLNSLDFTIHKAK